MSECAGNFKETMSERAGNFEETMIVSSVVLL
jgi:hypothetical protein